MFHKHFSMLLIVIACLILTSVFTTHALAQKLKVVTFPIPVMVESAKEGVFVELVNVTSKLAGLDVSIEVLPTKRAIESFVKGEFDMLFPGLHIQFYGDMDNILPSSELIYTKIDFAFVKKENTPIKTIDDLKNKVIGITEGYPYSEKIVFNKELNIQSAISDEINVKNLVNNRIDVFIVEEKSGLGAIKKAGAENKIIYDKEAPISKQDVYFAFHKTPEGKQLEKKFSTGLVELKKNGTFGKIMAKAEK